MKGMRIVKQIGFVLVGSLISITHLNAQDSTMVSEDDKSQDTSTVTEVENATVAEVENAIVGNVESGRAYFDGSEGFLHGGPACITCHNVTNRELIPGGLLAKDLTDVYERMGEGITSWLGAPPFPAMVSSYQNNPLTELERASLTAFFKQVNEAKEDQVATSGATIMLIGGTSGLLVILLIIGLMWAKRKKKMVKKDIFARQSKTWDAKF